MKLTGRPARWRMVAAVAAAAGLVVATSSASEAATLFIQTWGSGSYHASKDFTPSAGGMHAGTLCRSGGAARYSYTGFAYTRNGARAGFASFSFPCDGNWRDDPRTNLTAPGGTSYYMQWYGQDSNLNNGYSSPGAGARATR